jgi:predicted metal-dependent enzyme (double-stranded beta helix superfamily)
MSRRSIIAGAAALAAAGGAHAQPSRASRFEIARFIEDVRRARRETESQRAVETVLTRAVSDSAQVLAAFGEPTEVGVKEVFRAPDLTILNVIWSPYMVLMPHDHKMWASIGIYAGREDNIVWERHGQEVRAARATSVGEREVFSLPSDAVHSVTNPLRRLTCAIHIYGGDFFAAQRNEWDPETLRERPMDFEGVQRLFREANERFRGCDDAK